MANELFPDFKDDDRIEQLDNRIKYQWAFAHIFWPSLPQVERLAREHQVLAQTVLERCEQEFIQHCG